MIKRDITETIYEYDKEGKLVKKTVTEKHETVEDTVKLGDIITNPCTPRIEPYDWKKHQITCDQIQGVYLSGVDTNVATSTTIMPNNIKTTNGTIQG